MAGRDCTVCKDPRLAEIHAMADAGIGQAKVGAAFGFPGTTIKRHLREHREKPPTNPIAIGKLPGIDASVDPATLGEAGKRIHALAVQADTLLKRSAKETLAPGEHANIVRSVKGVLELLGKLTGELNPNAERRLLETPEWRHHVRVVVEALREFPEAREAVLSALRGSPPPAPAEVAPVVEREPEDIDPDEELA